MESTVPMAKDSRQETVEELLEASIANHSRNKENEWHGKNEIGTYHASMIPMCIRRHYWEFKNPKGIDDARRGVFEMGHAVHEYMQKTLSDYALSYEGEVMIPFLTSKGPVRIVGRYDMIGERDGEKFIVDFKTVGWMPAPDDMGRFEVKRHHVVQLNLYLMAAGIRTGYLLYINKNDMRTKAFKVEFDEKLFEKTKEKVVALNFMLRDNELPDPDNENWECKYCPYSEECAMDNVAKDFKDEGSPEDLVPKNKDQEER